MNKITISQAIKSLRENSPGFSLVIDRLVDKYADDEISWDANVEEYGGIYAVFNKLAKYLEGLLESNQENEIKKIFGLVEAWHTNGDERVQEAVTVGLLEDLISLNPDHKLQDEPFFAYMGDETKYWAEQVKGFWRDGTIISDHRNV
jgi:hypothetical protein